MPIVFKAATSHGIGVHGWPERIPVEQKDRFYTACDSLGEMLRDSEPDVVIYPTTDHFTNFSSGNMPQFCIGVADSYFGPREDFKTVPKGTVPGDPELGKELVGMFLENGFDPASSTDLLLDHGTITPVQFMTPDWDVPIIPIFVNIAVPPMPSLRRCYDFGRTLGEQCADHPKRIAVVGTGGLSHDPATGRIWHLSETFDRKFLDVVMAEGDPPVESMTPEDFAMGGAGSHEVKTWVMARGVAGATRGNLIHYEAVPGWSTGMAIVTFE